MKIEVNNEIDEIVCTFKHNELLIILEVLKDTNEGRFNYYDINDETFDKLEFKNQDKFERKIDKMINKINKVMSKIDVY